MVSEVLDHPGHQFILDLLDLTFAELFFWIYNNYQDYCLDSFKNTLKLRLQIHLSDLPSDLKIVQQ